MRKTLGQNVLRKSAFALACLALAGTEALADAMVTSGTVVTTTTKAAAADATPTTVEVTGINQTYSTSGAITTDGVTGTNVISYNPVASGSFAAPSSVGLGEFVVSTLPPGSVTSYKNTPFSITYNPVSVDGVPLPAGATPVTITGKLNGTITGSTSSVQAVFDPITSPVFSSPGSKYTSTINILNNPLDLVPSSASGRTTIQAHVLTTTPLVPTPGGDGNHVPEPTTFALLATSLVGLGLRHRLRARKAA